MMALIIFIIMKTLIKIMIKISPSIPLGYTESILRIIMKTFIITQKMLDRE
jgi:hypothetical protein